MKKAPSKDEPKDDMKSLARRQHHSYWIPARGEDEKMQCFQCVLQRANSPPSEAREFMVSVLSLPGVECRRHPTVVLPLLLRPASQHPLGAGVEM